MTQTVFPNLVTTEMESTIEWYQRNLNAQVKMTVPTKTDSAKASFATLIVAENDIMLQTVENLEEKYPTEKGNFVVGQGVALNVQVGNAQAIFEQLADTDAVVLQPADTFYGMHEFTIKDPNGYMLTVASMLHGSISERP